MTSFESAEGGVTPANGEVAVKSVTNGHASELEPTQPKRSKV